jgi:hypothetical protein
MSPGAQSEPLSHLQLTDLEKNLIRARTPSHGPPIDAESRLLSSRFSRIVSKKSAVAS